MTPPHRAAPSAESLLAAARDLVPMLRAAAPRHEAERRVSDEVAAALREAGFMRICRSTENGGWDMSPSVLFRVVREVARGDGSSAWVLSLGGLHPWLVGMFPPRAQDDVFGSAAEPIVIALTGNVGRDVRAERVAGGWRLDGRWTYASGVDVADWAAVLAEAAGDDGAPERRLMLVPRERFRIDHDSWRTLGMRGTGSKDVRLDGETVPEHRTLRWVDLQRGDVPGRERNRGAAYAMPATPVFGMSVAAPILAVAASLVGMHVDTVARRVPAGVGAPQTEDRLTLVELGRSASVIELGRSASVIELAFDRMLADVDAMWTQAARGEPFTVAQRARWRADAGVACDLAIGAADALVRNLGGSLLPDGPIERAFRDLHAMAAHFLVQSAPAAELHGRALLGLPMPPGARL